MNLKLSVIASIFFSLLVSCNSTSTQHEEVPAALEVSFLEKDKGEWLLTNHLFDSLLHLTRIETIDTVNTQRKFIFGNGKLNYELFSSEPSCGIGTLYLDSSHYQINHDTITFYFKGGYALDSKFQYNAQYLIDKKAENELIFKKVKTLLDTTQYIDDEISRMYFPEEVQ